MLTVSWLLSDATRERDALRHGRRSRELPSHLLHYSADKKPVVVWTATHRCNLHCAHCYTDSRDREYPGELTTAEAMAMVDDLAGLGSPVLLISGGEPLARPDVLDVAAHAAQRGMRTVLSTNGTLLDDEKAGRLAEIGVSYVGISIDGRPETHDRFRGMRGAFQRSMAALEACRRHGLKTGLRFTLTRYNQDDLPWLFELMAERQVPRLCLYHLAPTGRGARIAGATPSHAETRAALDLVFGRCHESAAAGREFEVLTADNHADAAYLWLHITRREPERADEVWQLLGWSGGNRSGEAVACIDSDGSVYCDQFWRWRPQGNIRERRFSDIWSRQPTPLLRDLRARQDRLPARCRACRFLPVCNGNFRARAEAVTGDPWGMDPLCYLSDEEVQGAAP